MATADEAAIQQLIDDMTEAWNRGDARAYGARYRADGTFTNVNGTFHFGREEFDRRHAEVLRGMFKDTALTMRIRTLRLIAADVAAVDVETTIAGCSVKLPGGIIGDDGALHSCLLLVLVKEGGAWWISAYHNVWLAAPR
jgi:uncharacterized protein (TIGR02246 family)